MASPFGPLTLIVAPRDGRGRVGEELPEVERNVIARGLQYRVIEVQGVADAEREARAALEAGDRYLVVVGGDQTIHGVVNGMVHEDGRPVAEDAVLAVVAAGSGSDFVRTFGLPGDATRSTAVLTGDGTFPIDLARATVATSDGVGTVTRCFANVAQAGLGAAMLARAERAPRRLGRGRYFLGFWAELARYKPGEVHVRVGSQGFDGPASTVVVANGQYHGEGRRISPRSWPSDGLLDVLVMTGPKSDQFTKLPQLYQGDHLPDPNIHELKGRAVEVETERPVPVEADGIVLGTTPASFEIVRLPIKLKI